MVCSDKFLCLLDKNRRRQGGMFSVSFNQEIRQLSRLESVS